jgi:hypothetical protein
MKTYLKLIFISSLFIIFKGNIHGQNNNQNIGIYAGSGLSAGWWLYQHGYSEAGETGWDRTHLSMLFPVGGRLEWQFPMWSVGVGFQYQLLNDDIMIAGEDRRQNRSRYFVGEKNKAIPITQYYAQFSWRLFQSEKIRVSPLIRAGTFSIRTLHPRENDFGFKGYLDWGISHQITLLPKLDLDITPTYTTMVIVQKNPINPQEQHRIYGLGVHIGLTGWILR